jgi:hypothetical protein
VNEAHNPFDWLPARAGSLLTGSARGVLVAASKDPDAKLTFVTTSGPGTRVEQLAVKIPTTRQATAAVEAEGRMLVGLRRLPLGALVDTLPRYVESLNQGDRAVLVSTVLPGSPMGVGYHHWMHTARPSAVRRDLTRANVWLRAFQRATNGPDTTLTWVGDVRDDLRGRWDGHPLLEPALARLMVAHEHLDGLRAPTVAVHGDFWFGNVLVSGDRVSGVVDWEAGALRGCPLRDPARFALSYCLYLDRHTRPGHRVPGHPGLRHAGFGAGIGYGLLGTSWLPRLVRSFLADGLEAVGLPRSLWYDVALAGIGEVAARANDESFGAGHLALLASLPTRPRRVRRQP